MNEEKWDKHALDFATGALVPGNGWEAWAEQAVREAADIREGMPDEVDTLVEVGSGYGRLTPYLALMFPQVVALDTSAGCRAVTAARCKHLRNVRVMAPPNHAVGDAAVIWHLYDEDWTPEQVALHRGLYHELYPLVLEG